MTDPRINPNADPLNGEKLDLPPEWRIPSDVQDDLDNMTSFEQGFIPAAKAMAGHLGETCPDAWVWYIGWAFKHARVTLQ